MGGEKVQLLGSISLLATASPVGESQSSLHFAGGKGKEFDSEFLLRSINKDRLEGLERVSPKINVGIKAINNFTDMQSIYFPLQ